jgi:quaternary ammonium compound-resistance protein SugE
MWTGLGIVGTTVLGVVMFKENISIPQVLCIGMIIVGIVGLKIMGE